MSDEIGLLRRRLTESGEGFERYGGHFVEKGSEARNGIMAGGVRCVIFIYLTDMV